MVLDICKLVFSIFAALVFGRIMKMLKLPSILGWLITGVVLGPYAFNMVTLQVKDSSVFHLLFDIIKFGVGIIFGLTLMIDKKAGTDVKGLFKLAFIESIGTFIFVSAVFSILLKLLNIPVHIAWILGAIAMGSTLMPENEIIKGHSREGLLGRTLAGIIPLNNYITLSVFLITIAVASGFAAQNSSLLLSSVFGFVIAAIAGAAVGYITSKIINHLASALYKIAVLLVLSAVFIAVLIVVNSIIFQKAILNSLVAGISLAAVLCNKVKIENPGYFKKYINPVSMLMFAVFTLEFGTKLNYKLIFQAGILTFVYMLARAAGIMWFSLIGCKKVKSPDVVKKFLGFTLLPHIGICIIISSLALDVLTEISPYDVQAIQVTIASAVLFNEIAAVVLARAGLKMAGEIQKGK